MKAVSEVRALEYVMLEAQDIENSDDGEELGDALSVIASLATDTGLNVGILLVSEDGQNYRLIVFKDSE